MPHYQSYYDLLFNLVEEIEQKLKNPSDNKPEHLHLLPPDLSYQMGYEQGLLDVKEIIENFLNPEIES